jgi:hypothetical protein
LESKGNDVILGDDRLSKHKIPIDWAEKSVKVTTLDRNELEYIIEPMVIAKGVANCVKLNQLYDSQGPEMPVVNESS